MGYETRKPAALDWLEKPYHWFKKSGFYGWLTIAAMVLGIILFTIGWFMSTTYPWLTWLGGFLFLIGIISFIIVLAYYSRHANHHS